MPKAYKKQVTQMQTHNNNTPLQHCNRVKNANPNYTVPSNHTTRLAFVRDLVEKSQKINIVKSDAAVYMRPATNRKKIYYPDREKAMRALATVFCEHVNIVTHQVQISLRNAADACGSNPPVPFSRTWRGAGRPVVQPAVAPISRPCPDWPPEPRVPIVHQKGADPVGLA